MSITCAKQSDIDAMKNRLKKKRDERLAEHEINQVIKMVQKTPFVPAPENQDQNVEHDLFYEGMKFFLISFSGAFIWNIFTLPVGLFVFVPFSIIGIRKFVIP